MNLSEPFIMRPVMTSLVMFAIFCLGILCYNKLAVSNLPDVNYPTLNVTTSFPGASPEVMANSVATPLEQGFMTIPGILSVTSTNTLGSSSIVLQFDINKNIDNAAVDVLSAIQAAKPQLPPNLPADPTYKKVNPSDTPIIYISLTSETMPLWQLYNYAYTFIGQRISMLDGVAQVLTYGSPFAVRVQVDPGSLASRGITLDDVSTAVNAGNPYLPLGQTDGPDVSAILYADGQLQTAAEYNPLVVAYRAGAPVRVQDIGKAVDSELNDRYAPFYYKGNEKVASVTLAVLREPGSNTVQVADSITHYLPQLLEQLPASVDMRILFDRSQSIRESVADVKFTLFMAFILVVLVVFIYLGKWTDTIIPSLVLPMSIVMTFIFMYLFNFSIDNLSLLAMTLAIGFIIDDAIVVIESIIRNVEAGYTPLTAALKGTEKISFTILSMTFSLIAVFIPLVFMAGLIGKLFQEFALTLVIVTLASGFISLTLTPMLCSRFIPPRYKEEKIGRIEQFSKNLNSRMLDLYKPALKWVLERRPLALIVGLLSVVFSLILFASMPLDFLPNDDIGFIVAYTQAEEGTSSMRMSEYQEKIVQVMLADPAIEALVSIPSNPQYRQGIILLRLKPISERKSAVNVIQGLYPKLQQIPGVTTFLKNVPLIDLSIGTQNKGQYQYILQSTNSPELYRVAQKLLNKMEDEKMFQGISSDLEVKTPQVNITILRDQASALGITAGQIETALSLALSGNLISKIQSPINQFDVILELGRTFQYYESSLSQIYLRSLTSGQMVPLNAVAKWKEGVGVNTVSHLSQFPAVNINFSVIPGVPLGQGVDRLKQIADEILTPVVTGDVKGAAQIFIESIKASAYLLIIAVIAVYIILGILYESFIHPITILSTLPPATLGGLLILWIFNYPLSLYGFLGIILLIGIVKKNGIMVVDYALDYMREKGESAENAVFDACIVRFRPIMMTTVAAIMGAVPIVLGTGAGAESRRPLGLVIIGGLILSQMITLFLTPVIYLYMERYNEMLSPKALKEGDGSTEITG